MPCSLTNLRSLGIGDAISEEWVVKRLVGEGYYLSTLGTITTTIIIL